MLTADTDCAFDKELDECGDASNDDKFAFEKTIEDGVQLENPEAARDSDNVSIGQQEVRLSRSTSVRK